MLREICGLCIRLRRSNRATLADRLASRYGAECRRIRRHSWRGARRRSAEGLSGRRLPYAIEVVGFSEEEGVRFGAPFIGSRALVGRLDDDLLDAQDAHGISVRQAIEDFGLNPAKIAQALSAG